jgi:hypothetical protein
MTEPGELGELRKYVASELRGEIIWTKLWSFGYHGSLFASSILSALAALTLQLKSLHWDTNARADLAACLAALASILGIVSVSGRFAQKWRANRMTKATLEEIVIDLMDPACDPSKIRAELRDMKRIHHTAIVGEDTPPKTVRS